MATSERKIAANRANALLAKGPVSAAGKANSRKNALKHGLTGKGVVLPADMEAEIEAKTARWVAEMEPADEFERQLLGDAVRACVRKDRAFQMEMARLKQASARALTSWAEDRRIAAEELATKLAKKPGLVARQLRRTMQGCELVIERWRVLLRVAEAGNAWDEGQRGRALDLLGVPAEDRGQHPRVNAKATAEDCAAIAREEIEHLEGRRDGYLEDDDEADRLLVESGIAFDDSPTGRRLWGYERTNHNIFLRGMTELRRRRVARGLAPAAPRPQREPAAVVAGTIEVEALVASMLRGPSADATVQDGETDGTRSVPATRERPPTPVGNRRQRRAQRALARRRG
jgi:hypothetical protein